jgi:hypothetical protein
MLTPDERGQLDALTRRLRARHAAIDADPGLSIQGKRARKAREQLAAEQVHRQITEASDARHARESRNAYFRAFGMQAAGSSDVLADRDARQFAAKIDKPADALRELASADMRGDVSLSRAIGERAWTMRGPADFGDHWEGVLAAYAASSPDRNRELGALAALDSSKTDRLTESFYRYLGRPDDLKHGDIEALAASADTTEGH